MDIIILSHDHSGIKQRHYLHVKPLLNKPLSPSSHTTQVTQSHLHGPYQPIPDKTNSHNELRKEEHAVDDSRAGFGFTHVSKRVGPLVKLAGKTVCYKSVIKVVLI